MDQLQEILLTLLYGFLIVGVSAAVKLGADFIRARSQHLAAQVHNEKMRHVLLELSNVVSAAVAHTGQVYVDGLKKTGSFDIKAQTEALRKAKATALASLSTDAKAFLQENHEDIQNLLETKIEEVVRTKNAEERSGKKAAENKIEKTNENKVEEAEGK